MLESKRVNTMADTPRQFNAEQPSRLDRIEAVLERVTEQQRANTQAIGELTQETRELTSNVDRVLARSAILDDVLLELRDSHEQQQRHFEQHQRNFEQHQQNFEQHQRNVEENQRTTNAALERLEVILMQLMRRFE